MPNNQTPGCALAAVAIVITLVLIVAGIVALNSLSNSAANYETARGNAEAAIIRAHGQASLDRAEAAAIRAEATTAKLFAALPWGVLVIIGLSGFGLIALSAVVLVVAFRSPGIPSLSRDNHPPARIIERQIIYLPHPTPAPLPLCSSAPLPEPEPEAKTKVIYL